jgi:hypothetical protein
MMHDPQATAERLIRTYKHTKYTKYTKYTPAERATDHAFAYDSKDEGRKFWIAVLQAIYRINEGLPS